MKKSHRTAGLDQLGPSHPIDDPWNLKYKHMHNHRFKGMATIRERQNKSMALRKVKITLATLESKNG